MIHRLFSAYLYRARQLHVCYVLHCYWECDCAALVQEKAHMEQQSMLKNSFRWQRKWEVETWPESLRSLRISPLVTPYFNKHWLGKIYFARLCAKYFCGSSPQVSRLHELLALQSLTTKMPFCTSLGRGVESELSSGTSRFVLRPNVKQPGNAYTVLFILWSVLKMKTAPLKFRGDLSGHLVQSSAQIQECYS